MTKRFALAASLVGVLALAACAGGGTTTGGGGDGTTAPGAGDRPSLLIWVDAVREPPANMFKDMVAGEIDVTVEVVAQEEMIPKIALANQTGGPWPDLVFAPPNDIAIWADPSNGYALALDDYLDPAVIDSYETSNDWCLINGQYWCLKNDLAQTVLWYDTALFEELNLSVPTTMDEWAAEAAKLEGTGYSAGAIGDQGFYAAFLWPSGCPMTSVDDADSNTVRIDPDAPECARVAELVQPLVDKGVLDRRSSFDASFISDVAQAGKLAMTFGPSWFGEFVIRPADSFNIPEARITAAPMPKWAGESTNWSGEWGGGIWAASARSAFPQEAVDAIVYLATSVEVAVEGVTFPGSRAAFEAWTAKIDADPYYASSPVPAMVEQASRIRQSEKPVRFNAQGQIGAVLQTELNGGSSVADATRAFQESLRNLAPQSAYTVVP
jgi:ABC-type glycerol-3-phosphate transport system substrate-binding protein